MLVPLPSPWPMGGTDADRSLPWRSQGDAPHLGQRCPLVPGRGLATADVSTRHSSPPWTWSRGRPDAVAIRRDRPLAGPLRISVPTWIGRWRMSPPGQPRRGAPSGGSWTRAARRWRWGGGGSWPGCVTRPWPPSWSSAETGWRGSRQGQWRPRLRLRAEGGWWSAEVDGGSGAGV